MLISHYDHLVSVEGLAWGLGTALHGAEERLVPILMTAFAVWISAVTSAFLVL